MENLAKAIVAVMKEIKGIEKTTEVGFGASAYKGVPDQEVKKIIGESMQRNGLSILPIEVEPTVELNRWEESYNGIAKQKQSVFTTVRTKYLLLHISGESQVISGYGHGADSQDKGAGKATTYALKYTLLYLFMVPTGKIDDSDGIHSDQIDTPKQVLPEFFKTLSEKIWDAKNKLDTANAKTLGPIWKSLSKEVQDNDEVLAYAANVKSNLGIK